MPDEIADNALQNTRAGYKAALDLWTIQGNQSWTRFNALLVANSVFLAAVGWLITRQTAIPPVALSVLGVVLCVLWFLLLVRGIEYQEYWVRAVRELEQRLEGVDIVNRGKTFGEGAPVEFALPPPGNRLRMTCIGRFKGRHAMYGIIAFFVMLYVGLAALPILLDQPSTPVKEVRARHLVAVDGGGKVRAELTVSRRGTPSLNLLDRDGRLRATVTLEVDGSPTLSLFDKDGKVIWKAP